jgi:hypothetical protein
MFRTNFLALLPLLLAMSFAPAMAAAQTLPCEGWATIPGQTNPYHEGHGYAAAFYDFDGDGPEPEQLVIGGASLNMLGAGAGNIYRWDGQRWHVIGGGFDKAVYALKVYNGVLYAAGEFAVAGIQDMHLIAQWRNGVWAPVAADDGTMIRQSNSIEYVRALEIYDGKLVIGGRFTLSGVSPNPNIVTWDGSTFGALGTGVDGYVRAMTTHREELVVGGDFSSVAGRSARNLARWNGSAWAPVGPSAINQGTSYTVRALASYDGALYIGGDFTSVGTGQGSLPARYLAGLDDTGWFQPAGGVDRGIVRALLPTNRGLVVAGQFKMVGSMQHRGLATLRNGAWSRELGDVPQWDTDVNTPSIAAMIQHEGSIVFTGYFLAAGGAGGAVVTMKSPDRWVSFAGNGLAGIANNSSYNSPDIESVFATALYRGEYYIGGTFRSNGGDILGGLAKWNGRTWVPVTGWEGTSRVYSLRVGDDKLWVSGRLKPPFSVDQPGEVLAAVFDGTTWRWAPSQTEIYGTRDASFWNHRIVMAGSDRLHTWNGESWEQLPPASPPGRGGFGIVASFNGDLYSSRDSASGLVLLRYDQGQWTEFPDIYVNPFVNTVIHENRLAIHGNSDLVLWDGTSVQSRYGAGYINSLMSAGGSLYFRVSDTGHRPPWPDVLVRFLPEGRFVSIPRFNPGGDEGRPVGEFFGHLFASHRLWNPPRPDADGTALFVQGRPTIIGQPVATAACPHQPLRLDIVAVGMGMTYQWRRDGVPIEFATESVYEDVFPGDSQPGLYDCIITNPCGEVVSEAVRYAPCVADHDCNGFIDFFDYADFVADFETGSPKADTNRDGFLDAFDFALFVESFETGC